MTSRNAKTEKTSFQYSDAPGQRLECPLTWVNVPESVRDCPTVSGSFHARITHDHGARCAEDARRARHITRLLGVHRARRRAWRETDGDPAAFTAAMREEVGYLFPYAHEPLEPPTPESIGRTLAINVMRVTAACILVAIAIILWDLIANLQQMSGG